MLKRKLSKIILITMITNLSSVPLNAFAETLRNISPVEVVQSQRGEIKADINKFSLYGRDILESYNNAFKMNNSNISSITNNGGTYSNSTIDKAVDENFSTHWETGKPNSTSFTNEVVVNFNEAIELNRIVYAARRDGAKGKGFPQKLELYASTTDEGDNFNLVCEGEYKGSTGDIVEIKFKPSKFKRVKFVFKQANQGWASASEFMFYKEDQIWNKMSRLFTDASLSKISEEFNSIDKLNKLEKEVKVHPLYNDFKDSIEDAKNIIASEEVKYTDAKVSKFLSISDAVLPKYDEVYKIPSKKITSISTNGGHYGSSNIEKAIDGDFNTSWHSGRTNNDSFTNEVVMTLDEVTALNRIVYTAARGTNRGFAEAFDLYISTTSKGDTFELVTSGNSEKTQDSIEIKFNPVEARRIKFVFKKGYENWALAAEIGLYKQDETSEKIERLFTDNTMTSVSEEFSTLEKITKLEEECENHPLKEKYADDIKLAKSILSNPDIFDDSRIVTAEQRGNYREETGKRSINGGAYASFESVGKYVTAGEEIVVYVDADANGVLPTLCFGQVGKDKGDWRRWANLKPGKNVIKAPSGINPSALYVVNNASKEDQAYAPRVRVEGGTKFPTYFHGETDPDEFFKELKAYSEKVEFNDSAFENGNPQGKVYNIAEFVSENCNITTTAMGAVAGLERIKKDNLTIYDTMKEWEEMYDMFQKFQGFSKDAEEEKDTYFPNKFIARVFQGVPLGFADHGYTGYLGSNNIERDGGFFKLIAMPISYSENDNWCYNHEFGHIFNTGLMVDGEVTNNLYAQEYRRIKGIKGDRANWDEILKRFKGEEHAFHYFERLGVLSQLNIAYGYDAYAKASTALRENKDIIKSIQGSDTRRLAIAYSLGLGVNLLDFFEGWGYTDVTPEMRNLVKDLPKETRKIEYLHGGAYDYKGDGFTEDVKITVTNKINKDNNTNTLSFGIDKENSDDLLGYEIFKDGEYLGYTRDNTFVDKAADPESNHSYKVVAYAKDLSTARPVERQLKEASLLADDRITVKLNEEFKPLDNVNAFDYLGNEVTEIKVTHNVDTTKKGSYIVKYEIVSNDITVTKSTVVEVVSGYDYLSDFKWSSVKTQWGTPRQNSNLKLLVNGKVKNFEKGFGIHANGEIVYDLSDKTYDKFEALVGVDRSIGEQNNSSVKFSFLADGKEVYNSGLMKYNDNAKLVSIDISKVKELKIVINDGGNGNTSDHTVIAETKITTNNMKPSLTVPDKIYKLGETVNLKSDVSASDSEDGDLTDKVEIVSNNYEEGKLGRFEVVYRVSDSEKNIVEKKAYITVYEDLKTVKSKYSEFKNLEEYNRQFKISEVSASNNGGNYGSSVIKYAVDSNRNSHWETGRPNSDSFKNEVVFNLGDIKEIDKIGYAARNGGKGFAKKFEIYVSTEAEDDDFILAGVGSYSGNINDVIEIDIAKTKARRVKFKFIEAHDSWASIGEMSFYKTDELADKISKELFVDSSKTEVNDKYNTLEKLDVLRKEVLSHPGAIFFQDELNKAEEIIRAKFPTLTIPNSQSTKVGQTIDVAGKYFAIDNEDGDLTSKVLVMSEVNFNKPGEYNVTYTVTDSSGNTTTATRTIAVVDMNDFKYLTDYDWKTTNNSYAAPNKNKAHCGKALRLTGQGGNEVVYEKGLGTHSTSTVVYDLSDKNYDYFTSYVGVDRQMYGTVGSVVFQVYVDGVKKYDSGLMNSRDIQKYIEVDINGAKELKLVVTDGGNGNGSDHATWGDTKLHYANSL